MGEILEYVLLGNATLFAAFLFAWLFEKIIILTSLRKAYKLRLHLAVAALCAAALPILLQPVLSQLANIVPINGIDFLVSQYLKGNISLSALQVEQFVTAKNTLFVMPFDTLTGIGVVLFSAFLTAASFRAGYIFLNLMRIKRHIKYSSVYFTSRRIEIRTTKKSSVLFSTRGLFKYYILIPESFLSDRQALRIALGHEAQHIRQGDIEVELLLSFVSPLFVLNPAFWFLSDRIRCFREYACDAAFLNKTSIAARDYCLLLLEIASRASRENSRKYLASVPFFGFDGIFNLSGKGTLKKRILALSKGEYLIDGKAGRLINILPAFALILAVSAVVLMAAKPADWSHDRLMLSAVVNLERLDRINGFGVPPLR